MMNIYHLYIEASCRILNEIFVQKLLTSHLKYEKDIFETAHMPVCLATAVLQYAEYFQRIYNNWFIKKSYSI